MIFLRLQSKKVEPNISLLSKIEAEELSCNKTNIKIANKSKKRLVAIKSYSLKGS